MEESQIIDTRDSIKVVTSNRLITAKGLAKMSLKARKLFYLVMSQCRKTDQEFYLYEISANELALQFDIGVNHVYETADKLTGELMGKYIDIREVGGKNFERYTLFSKCEYKDGILRVKLNPDMTNLLLGLKKSFTQLLLTDITRMRSTYSIAIWHLMQREMRSKKPYSGHNIEFDLSLEELRTVTGTESKLRQIVEFKKRVLDKALREIKENGLADIIYTNIKRGRTVTGFHFTARTWMNPDYEPEPEVVERWNRIHEAVQRNKASGL